MVSLAEWLTAARSRLEEVSETPSLDAQVLLAHGLEQPRSWVLAHGDAALPNDRKGFLERALQRLEAGEPLPYVLGRWEFYGRSFLVSPAVLIPRPETELLVEQALAWLRQEWRRHSWRRDSWRRYTGEGDPLRPVAVDVGTGSGCIAVTLAAELPDLHVVATDFSAEALAVARSNAAQLGIAERISFVRADLLPPGGPYDLVCANLPYIPTSSLSSLKVTQYEPGLALDGGPDGLALVRRLLAMAPPSLSPAAALLLEIEDSQGQAAHALAADSFPQARIEIFKDLAGHDRLLAIYT